MRPHQTAFQPDRAVPPTRLGQKANFPAGLPNRHQAYTARPCHACGTLVWAADGVPGRPECPDCPRKVP